MMVSAGLRIDERREKRPAPRVVIVMGTSATTGKAYRVEAPDRVLRMFGLLTAARDELDLRTLPAASRARVQRMLDTVRAELERSVSPALADELNHLVCRVAPEPSGPELRLEFASILGWASGLVVGMFDVVPTSAASAGVAGGLAAGAEGDTGAAATQARLRTLARRADCRGLGTESAHVVGMDLPPPVGWRRLGSV